VAVYLDYNASTPVDPAVREAMLPYLGPLFGNPSSNHAMGRRVREAVEQARAQTASLIGAKAREIVFTSSGTEANNHVIKGVAQSLRIEGNHVITSKVEHPAVLNPCRHLESLGYEISYVDVDSMGRVDPQEVAGEVRGTTVLISIMHSNNEVGTLQNIAEIAAIAREGGVLMHTDAAQSCGKVPLNVNELGVAFLSVAGIT
jgi:cysteine desulfurase